MGSEVMSHEEKVVAEEKVLALLGLEDEEGVLLTALKSKYLGTYL